jgi:hypothetical protein
MNQEMNFKLKYSNDLSRLKEALQTREMEVKT